MIKKEKRKVSTHFAAILALISIFGFLNIVLESFLDISISNYFDSMLLLMVGIGFLMAAKPRDLYENVKKQFTETSLSRLTTLVIGIIAIVSAILTLPQIDVAHDSLAMVKSIIAIIAIIFIFLQTWVLDH